MSEYTRKVGTRRASVIGVSIAILVCFVCYFLTITVMRPSARKQTLDQDGKLAQSTPQGDIEFELVAAGEGDVDAVSASFRSYRSSDGVAVLFLTEVFGSASSARAAFEKRANNARSIIERGVKVDREGNVIGERAVLLFFDRTETDEEMVAVLWTRKTDLLVIKARSLEHALAFERKYCR